MQISSYTFQSPYPQPFQVGRPDPASAKKEEGSEPLADPNKERAAQDAKIAPTKETESKITVSIGALTEGNNQSSVAAFKSLSTSVQGQKAYAQAAS